MKQYINPPITAVFSLMGFIIAAIYTASGRFDRIFASLGENFGLSIGFSFCIVFIMIFIASIITSVPSDEELKSLK